jgi:alkanesulfonate monooxygenase SsuD/methylene tetrahydromethanopterin reductase-like flavin-dependent oxidoreductase (luciferase family)
VKIGIGLPAAVPGRPAEETARWAVESERHGFYSVGVIDRLVYDLLDPMVALAAAAAVTDRLRLTTTVLNVGWRNNAVLMAKQLGSLDQISGGRLTAGLGLGAWEDDYKVSGVPFTGRGKALDKTLTELRQVWDGEVTSLSGPIPKLPGGGPTLLLGGLVPAAFRRAARFADGWLAPTFDYDLLNTGVAGVREEWAKAGRTGEPTFATARYFCLGKNAEAQRDSYAVAYYGGDDILPVVGPHAVTNDDELTDHLTRVKEAGVSELVLLPCTATFDQIELLAEALERVGARRDPVFEF